MYDSPACFSASQWRFFISNSTIGSTRLNFPISPDFMTSYKRIQVVGKGSFGCCWLVRNQSGERCILKEIDVSTMSKQHRTEAATEVSVLKKLMHPYIISYRDSFLDGSLLCIIMDFAEQGDLYRVIERRKKSGTLLPETLVMRQGLVNVPWLGAIGHHLIVAIIDHIPNGWVMFNGDI